MKSYLVTVCECRDDELVVTRFGENTPIKDVFRCFAEDGVKRICSCGLFQVPEDISQKELCEIESKHMRDLVSINRTVGKGLNAFFE